MKIGIDVRPLVDGNRSGVEEYIVNLLNNLFAIDRDNEYKLFCSSYSEPKFDFSVFDKYPNVAVYHFKYPNKILNLAFKYLKYPHMDKMMQGVDVFFQPNILFSAVSRDCKRVTTFHDLSFVFHSKYYSAKRRLWHYFVNPKKLAHESDKIISVSNSTRNDLINFYNMPPEKITAIHSGVAFDNEQKSSASRGLPEKYILYLGVIEPRKNIVGIISAYEKLRRKDGISHKLLLAGSIGWKVDKIMEKIESSKYKKDIILYGRIRERDRSAVYKNASLFAFPSFYEGFGFPPLEAMSNGVPVVTSSVSSLPEVCGNAALYTDPYNVEEIYQVMRQVLIDPQLQNILVERGYKQVEKYKWENTAREVKKVFEELAS